MLSLYVHIPFCRARCSYCDFYLVTRQDFVGAFFKALLAETRFRSSELKGRSVGAIHFGGGTPSMVPVAYLAGWLREISALCSLTPDIEITLEANPEDLDREKMDELHAAGITRLSIGVQSFLEPKLQALGRAHSAQQSSQVTAEALQRFRSVSVDLICGVPGEDVALWERDLGVALGLRPHHVSVYMLSVEPKTLLHRKISLGQLTVPDEGEQASMYEAAQRELLLGGYQQYEVSNFSLPGFHSRYNLASWQREPYLGFGPSAHSFSVSDAREFRTANVSSLKRYIEAPEAAEGFREELQEEQRFTEQVFLSLRINRGLDVEILRKVN